MTDYIGRHRGPDDGMGDENWIRRRLSDYVFWFRQVVPDNV